jgi:hypothetical protein
MTVAIFWRGSLYLLFCKYRDKKLRPGSHPALPVWRAKRFSGVNLEKLMVNIFLYIFYIGKGEKEN